MTFYNFCCFCFCDSFAMNDFNDFNGLDEIAFHCALSHGGCGSRFNSCDFRREDFPEREWLAFRFIAVCPRCGEDVEQAAWQLAQWKAIYDNGSPGPKSKGGRLKISEANRRRDPASYDISRFNAITHGTSAEVAKFYPARPGHYPSCDGCEFLDNGCKTEMSHCAKRTELFVQFQLAQEEGDGRLLGKLMATTQAGLAAITSDMIRSIALRGVDLERPEFTFHEGQLRIAKYLDPEGNERVITRVEANPLLSHLINFVQKNNITLGDMGLTPAAKDDDAGYKGFLNDEDDDRESLAEARQLAFDQMKNLQKLIGGEGVTIEDAGHRVIEASSGSSEALADED